MQFGYPIEHSRIQDQYFEDMTDLWDFALRELMGIDPATADILIIDSSANSKKYKAKIIEKVFEKLKAQ